MSLSNRRFKVIALDPMAVMTLLCANHGAPDRLIVAHFPDLPEGCEFDDIAYDTVRNCFMVRVTHPDWDEVEAGQAPDIASYNFTARSSEYVNTASLDAKVAEMYRKASGDGESLLDKLEGAVNTVDEVAQDANLWQAIREAAEVALPHVMHVYQTAGGMREEVPG